MPAPSQLAIATSALQRLVKEESSYHKELEQQQARISKLEGDTSDENAEFLLNQERRAIEETKNVFPSLKDRIIVAMEKLEHEIETTVKQGSDSNVAELTKAKETISSAKTSYREIA